MLQAISSFETDVLKMVNPLATIVFDLFLIGTLGTVAAAMLREHLAGRATRIGGHSVTRARVSRPAVMVGARQRRAGRSKAA